MSVYFITARVVNRVKIGFANNPQARVDHLQTGSPVLLKLEAVMCGSYSKERELHQRFDRFRVRGEWFDITPEIEELIAANPPEALRESQALSRPHFLHPEMDPSDPWVQLQVKRYETAMAESRPLDLEIPAKRKKAA